TGVYRMRGRGGPGHRVMERLGHSAIFALIAGTFTPAPRLLFRGLYRWGPLVLVWAAAVAGIGFKAVFFDDVAEWLGLTFYLTLGWFGGLSAILLARRYGFALVKPLLLGGVAYTVGGVMEYLGWLALVPGVIHAHEV